MRFEDFAINPDDIADIQQLKQLVFELGHFILAQVNLNVAGEVAQIQERRFTVIADRHDTTGNRDLLIFQVGKLVNDLLIMMCPVKLLTERR